MSIVSLEHDVYETEGDEFVARTLPEGFHVTTLTIGTGDESAEVYGREQELALVDQVQDSKESRSFVARKVRSALREQCRDIESSVALEVTLEVFEEQLASFRRGGRSASRLLSEPTLAKEIAFQHQRIATLRTAELARLVCEEVETMVSTNARTWIETASTPVSKPKRRNRRRGGKTTADNAKSSRKTHTRKGGEVKEAVTTTASKPRRRSRRGRKTSQTKV